MTMPSEQHAEEIGVEGQDQRKDRLIGPERIEHQAHAVPIGDGQREQQDRQPDTPPGPVFRCPPQHLRLLGEMVSGQWSVVSDENGSLWSPLTDH